MTRGATLLELTLVLVIIGLLSAITLPRIGTVWDRLAVDQAAQELVAAHRRARITAVLRAEVVELAVDGDSLVIRPRGAAAALWHAPGPAAAGVSLAGPPRQILFSPLGLSMGLANGTYRLSRGAAVRSVIISRLGRVRSVVP